MRNWLVKNQEITVYLGCSPFLNIGISFTKRPRATDKSKHQDLIHLTTCDGLYLFCSASSSAKALYNFFATGYSLAEKLFVTRNWIIQQPDIFGLSTVTHIRY